MKTFGLTLIFILFALCSFAQSPFMFGERQGFMLGGKQYKKNGSDDLLNVPIIISTSVKTEKPIIIQPPAETRPVPPEPVTTSQDMVMVAPSTAQSFAIRAGIPTFVSTFYNPDMTLRGVSWQTAATSGLLAGVVGVGFEMYDQNRTDGVISYTRVAQTGALVGGATFTGVMVGQATQRVLLLNSYGMVGVDSSGVGAQMFSGFMGDFFGSSAASVFYAAGAYTMGWLDGADARSLMAKGMMGSVILAAGKTVGTQALFYTAGSSGAVTAFGPYAITYLAALGAVYVTNVVFREMDKQERNELLGRTISNMIE